MAAVERAFADIDLADFRRLSETGYVEAEFVPRRPASSIRAGQTSGPAARNRTSRAPRVGEDASTEAGKPCSDRAAADDSKAIVETMRTQQVTHGTKNTPSVMEDPTYGSIGGSETGGRSSDEGGDESTQSSTISPTLPGTRTPQSESVLSRLEPSQAAELHP